LPLTINTAYCEAVDDSGEEAAAIVAAGGPGCDAGRPHAGAGEQLGAADGLIQLSRLVQGIFARTSERHGLTAVQAKLLCVLAGGPRGMAELARCFGVEKAALTGLVDRAERRGLVRRSPVPGDRRAVHVALTDSGRRAAAAFHADATGELNELLAPLRPAAREQFRRAMAEIIAAADPTAVREPA
jgi:DNA-binding MarR family transcriptional regulator